LLDLMMPGINGWEVLAALRHARREIPVVILSAVPNSGSEDCVYIQKPVSFERLTLLVETIREHLTRRP